MYLCFICAIPGSITSTHSTRCNIKKQGSFYYIV
jgi:hypothetical protein